MKAVHDARPPTSVGEVRGLLGMAKLLCQIHPQTVKGAHQEGCSVPVEGRARASGWTGQRDANQRHGDGLF